MNTKHEEISIAGIPIEVVRKDIKHMHLAVYPPTGRVRLAAPQETDDEVLRLFAIAKLGWIKKHIRNFNTQPREAKRQYVSGESHYVQGKRYILEVIPHEGRASVRLQGTKKIQLYVPTAYTRKQRDKVMKAWYRKMLKEQLLALSTKWESIIGVQPRDYRIQQMRTKWGSCNPDTGRVLLNLELAKKPISCLEYILVHELVHLLERNHNDTFIKYMDTFMPKWRHHRATLNQLPVAHDDWGY